MFVRRIRVVLAQALFLLLTIALFSFGAHAAGAIFYVDPVHGNDSSSQGPFKTLERAKNVVRNQIAQGMSGDVIVYLREGTYRLSSPLVFTEADSGRNGHSVIYASDGGEARIVGSRSIDPNAWEFVGNGIYGTRLTNISTIETLFENDVQGFKARHPNKEYSQAVAVTVDGRPAKDRFGFSTGNVPRVGKPGEVEVKIWPGGPKGYWMWKIQKRGTAAIDYGSRMLRMSSAVPDEIGTGSRYYVQNALEFLDAPGEFYHDPAAGYLYYMPRELPIQVEVPLTTTLISIRGSSQTSMARGLRFEGLTFANANGDRNVNHYSGGAAIHVDNARDIVFRDCRIFNVGGHGIFLDRYVQNVEISGALIHDVGYHGICLKGPSGWASREPNRNRNNVVTNTLIHDVGRLVESGHGIWIYQAGDNRISNSRIYNTPKSSIWLEAPTASRQVGKTINGISVTSSNVDDTILNVNNTIEYNDFSHANLEGQDCGLIYHSGSTRGTRIINNRFHNSEISFSFGFGIYLDNDATNVVIERNLIHDLQHKGQGHLFGAIATKGSGHIIRNNVIANNKTHCGAVYSHRMMEDSNSTSRNLVFERNIFYNNMGERDSVIYWFNQWSDDRVKTSDHNLLYNSDGQYIVKGARNQTISWANWKTLFNNRFDQNSRIVNPQFVSPANGDFRFRSGSPALSLGIQEIDHDRIGLTSDFRFGEGSSGGRDGSGDPGDGGSAPGDGGDDPDDGRGAPGGGDGDTGAGGGTGGSGDQNEPTPPQSNGGCTLDPGASLELEWFLGGLAMVFWVMKRRRMQLLAAKRSR
jgi:hypothetical protein